MTNDTKNSRPPKAGNSSAAIPVGDAERQAIASLRGYTYQLAVSALSWFDLDEGCELYLEVAEDYARAARDALSAVQVKDTAGSGPITLNTAHVRDAIAAFVDLVAKNAGRRVTLHYLTTSSIGTEQKIVDRPAGQPGLIYWRKAATTADVEPLRAILTKGGFDPEVVAFVGARNNDQLRRELLQNIHWDCDRPDLAGVLRELSERLIVIGRDKFELSATEARSLVDVLLYRVLKTSVHSEPSLRVLRRADLYEAIDAATQVSVSRRAARAVLNLSPDLLGLGAGQIPAITEGDGGGLVPIVELPAPTGTIRRDALIGRIRGDSGSQAQIILVGASGTGKTLLAREIVGKAAFGLLDLRSSEPDEVAGRLDALLGRIGGLDFEGIIFDDFNCADDKQARTALARCLEGLRRRDRVAIITSYRAPSGKALAELGLDASAVVDVPYFSENEAGAIVRQAGGDAARWGTIAFAAGAQGHPQLVHAFVMGMAARGWLADEMGDIVIRGFASDDTEAEKEAARRSMAATLSEGARTYLYRLSLLTGRFHRDLALRIGALDVPLPNAGEELDRLVGPWVEAVGDAQYRVSPLAINAGQGMLEPEARRAVHEAVVDLMLARRSIDASDANTILVHAIAGKSAHGMLALSSAVLKAGNKASALLAEQFFILPMLTTARPLFPENSAVSVMLRLAQFRLLVAKGESDSIVVCVRALLSEIEAEERDDIRALLEQMGLSVVLNTLGIAAHLPDWMKLLRRFRVIVEQSPQLQESKRRMETGEGGPVGSFYGNLFSIGTANLPTTQRLEEVLSEMDTIPEAERAIWLASFEDGPNSYSVLVNSAWSNEQRGQLFNAALAAERFKRLSDMAHRWGERNLALQCVFARAVMLDEYLDDAAAAHVAIDEGARLLGDDVILKRAHAKIYSRRKEDARAVEIFGAIADRVGEDSAVDRAFTLRDAAISAARIGNWGFAAEWFGEAERAATSLDIGDMPTMAIGLGADRAVAVFKAGDTPAALRAMAHCLDRMRRLDPNSSLRAAYCHRLVRHAVLWLDAQIEGRETKIDGKPIEMVAGACSNPEPPDSIVDLPCGPLDLAWYMLAEAEIFAQCDVGMEASLRTKLQDGPILFMEVSVQNRRLSTDVARSDARAFGAHLGGYLAALALIRAQGKVARDNFDIMAPPRGEIPPLAAPYNENTELEARDAILAFELTAHFNGHPDPEKDLHTALIATLARPSFDVSARCCARSNRKVSNCPPRSP